MTPPVTRRTALAAALAVLAVPAVGGAGSPVGQAGQTLPDYVRAEVLRLLRQMTPRQQEAWLRAGRRMLDGMPAAEAEALMFRELRDGDAEADARVADAVRSGRLGA